MGATNTTANYSLSQFIGTDKPAWLQDYNGDMLKIDTGINAAKVAADGAQNAASAAQNDATTANNAITNTINPAISSLNTTVGNQGGSINTINSLIGNGTPTTTDQTIIGAINEINAKVGYTVKASITAGQYTSYSDALVALESVYDTLTENDKYRSAIVIDYGNYTSILRVNDTVLKEFSSVRIYSAGTTFNSFSLSDHKFFVWYGSSAPSDASSSAQSAAIKLVVI